MFKKIGNWFLRWAEKYGNSRADHALRLQGYHSLNDAKDRVDLNRKLKDAGLGGL